MVSHDINRLRNSILLVYDTYILVILLPPNHQNLKIDDNI